MRRILLSILLTGTSSIIRAQTVAKNPILTAVPVLNVSPDARSGAMGETGVALSADANSLFWNPSKIAFIEEGTSVSASYSPYLKNLDKEMNITYVSFIHKINSRTSFGGSVRYFDMGSVNLYDEQVNSLGVYSPNEFSFDASVARMYGDNMSLGLSLRFIHSNLSFGTIEENNSIQSINTAAADVSFSFRKNVQQFGKDGLFAIGANVSNIGPKVDYTATSSQYFLPTNLKLGAAQTWFLDEKSDLTLALDFNKLLVPTPPVRDGNGNIIDGKDDDRSVAGGIFGSFSDAPRGASEEFKEIMTSVGFEYMYNKQFALRAGYFSESKEKGNRRYPTVGAGLRFEKFDLDFSYLAASADKSPLANTIRFSLMLNFDRK